MLCCYVFSGGNSCGAWDIHASLLAIRFVLSDAYTSMSREERQALLHEGVSVTTTLSAYGTSSSLPHAPFTHGNHSRDCVRQLGQQVSHRSRRSYNPANDRFEKGRIQSRQEKRQQGRRYEPPGKRWVQQIESILYRSPRQGNSPMLLSDCAP